MPTKSLTFFQSGKLETFVVPILMAGRPVSSQFYIKDLDKKLGNIVLLQTVSVVNICFMNDTDF